MLPGLLLFNGPEPITKALIISAYTPSNTTTQPVSHWEEAFTPDECFKPFIFKGLVSLMGRVVHESGLLTLNVHCTRDTLWTVQPQSTVATPRATAHNRLCKVAEWLNLSELCSSSTPSSSALLLTTGRQIQRTRSSGVKLWATCFTQRAAEGAHRWSAGNCKTECICPPTSADVFLFFILFSANIVKLLL